MAVRPAATIATYCRPSAAAYVIGTACAESGSSVTQSSAPVRESNARKRPSLVAPTNTSPAAVTIGPPTLSRPVPRLLSGSSSVIPSGTRQTISPFAASTATSSPHGGFWHGHASEPPPRSFPDESAAVSCDQNRASGPPTALVRRYGMRSTRAPSPVCAEVASPVLGSSQPIPPSLLVLMKTRPRSGSTATPPQPAAPSEPGKTIVERGALFAARCRYGVNGPKFCSPPPRSRSDRQNAACAAVVSAATTMSSPA